MDLSISLVILCQRCTIIIGLMRTDSGRIFFNTMGARSSQNHSMCKAHGQVSAEPEDLRMS